MRRSVFSFQNVAVLQLVVATLLQAAPPERQFAPAKDRAETSIERRVKLLTQPVVREKSTVVKLDRLALASVAAERSAFVAEDIPLADGRRVDLKLEPFRLFSGDAAIVLGQRDDNDQPLPFDPSRILLLRGQLVGKPNSSVFMAISDRIVTGFIETGTADARQYLTHRSDGTHPLGEDEVAIFVPQPNSGFTPPVPFCGTDVPTDIPPIGHQPMAASGLPRVMQTLELAVDTDYEFFELHGDTTSAMDYVAAMYGALSHIFMRDVQIRVELVFVRLWDTPDDLFNEPDPLSPFRAHWLTQMNSVQRDTVQLLTGRRNLPYGGVAFVNGLCNAASFSVAGYMLGSFPDPGTPSTGHWDLVVTAHELGHNCGTRHTHDGYTPVIDSCASGELRRGTIMSYCHLQAGGTSNIDLRFHRRVQQVVRAFTSNTICIIDDCNMNSLRDNNDIFFGVSPDADGNGIPDECEDCNGNSVLDSDDISSGMPDLDGNGQPDICDPDCNGNELPDSFDLAENDANGNNVPDECDPDCNSNNVPDAAEMLANMALDVDRNGVLDMCQDCDGDGVTDAESLSGAHNLWMASDSLDYIAEYHARTGVEVRRSEVGFIQSATDLIISGDGRIFVADRLADAVLEFNRDGLYVGEFVASGSGGLVSPRAMAFARDGRLLVASDTQNNVLAFDGADGTFLGVLITATANDLDEPAGIAVGAGGDVYVSSHRNHRVLRYDGSTGSLIGDFIAPGEIVPASPRGLVFQSNGHLLVASADMNAVYEYDPHGRFLGVFTRAGNPSGFWELNSPWSVRIGPNRNVYVSSLLANVPVQMFDGQLGLFMRSFYVLNQTEQSPVRPTGIDFMPGFDGDCNLNNLPDNCDLANDPASDANGDGVPDACQTDCNNNGTPDRRDLVPFGFSLDCNLNGVLDECDVTDGVSNDCNDDGVPDECNEDCNGNGLADACEPDCNENGVADECDILAMTSYDFNADGRPDECPNPVDGDDDGDVDLSEFTTQANCYSGDVTFPAYQMPPDGCGVADLDGDGDIDLIDYGRFQAAYTGPCELAITTPPQGTAACLLDDVTLSVTATGDNLGYQWRHNGSPIIGATQSELSFFEINGASTGDYDVLVFNDCNITASPPANISVLQLPLISSQSPGGLFCRHADAQFTVAAIGFQPFTYQWEYRPDVDTKPVDVPGATSSTLVVQGASDDDVGFYRCKVTDRNGCSRRSDFATLSLYPDVLFDTQPSGGELCFGSQLVLFVSVTQQLSFQWFKDGNEIAGADAFFYMIQNVTIEDSGGYHVVANGVCGPNPSGVAQINVVDCGGDD